MATRATAKRMSARKGAPSPRRAARAGVNGSSVVVRMYRQGLGDCFLLRFPGESGRPFWMMIDFGIILGTPDPKPIMEKVLSDIIATTGGEIDVLVATHEHWDHLSGFVQVEDLFAQADTDGKTSSTLNVRQVWFAWTEDPENEKAQILRAEREKRKNALRMSLAALRAAEPDDLPAYAFPASEQVDSLLSFFGAAKGAGTTSLALDNLRTFSQKVPRYCHPGDPPITLKNLPGVRIYVLGPPDDEVLLKKSNPSKGQVYEEGFQLNDEGAFFAAVGLSGMQSLAPELEEIRELSHPFDRAYRIPLIQAKHVDFFQRHYWSNGVVSSLDNQEWRRIDGEWLESASRVALQLDSDTNNTSLAMAIELSESGKVLLFPGDAQVGNWLSWHERKPWKVDGHEVTAADLLARVVLYKVGHHGSHNATLREKGLEMMTNSDFVAMIPVDHEMAVKKRWTGMPFDPLLQRLEVKTQGRVLRVDDDAPPRLKPPGKQKHFESHLNVSNEILTVIDAKTGRTLQRPLYYEYTVDL